VLFIQTSDQRRACLDIGEHGLFGARLADILVPQAPGQTPLIYWIIRNGIDRTIVDNTEGTLHPAQEAISVSQALGFLIW
jgi:hypothetical protein